MVKFFKHGGTIAWLLILGIILAVAASVKLLTDTADLRYQRDVNRMVFNDNLGVLSDVRTQLGTQSDSMQKLLAATGTDTTAPYIVVSIADHRLWYKRSDSVLFTAPVATASGKELVSGAGGEHWRFETPRGRLTVIDKDVNPAWVPPDWYYVEQANKRGLGLTHLERGQVIHSSNSATYFVKGSDIVKQNADGEIQALPQPKEGHDIVVNGNIIVPPFGTNQRRYMGTLGTRRLDLGDGYGIHGTDDPTSVGQSVSHGCVRLHNEDVEQLYPMVPVGTAVYIY